MWVAQVSLAGTPRRYATRWCRTRYEAEDQLRVLLERHAFSSPDDRQTVGELVGQWLRMQSPRLAPSSRVAYDFRYRVMLPTLGSLPIGRLRVSDVERFVALRLADGKSPASIADSVGLLGAALESAVRDGVLARNVAKLAKLPPIERAKVQGMNAEEARAVLQATRGTPVEALVALLLGSGLRIGEALALDWSDVDLRAGVVHVRSGKTVNAQRDVPIPAPTVAVLRAHRTGLGRVFALTHQQAYRALRRACAAAGLPGVHPHSLRHAHASLLLAGGTDIRLIADQLGHSKASLTMDVYTHGTQERRREAVDRLGEELG